MGRFMPRKILNHFQSYICQSCGKEFKIKRGYVVLGLWELRRWLLRAQCPFCGKKLKGGDRV